MQTPTVSRVPLASVAPDPDQPRKLFRDEEMAQLRESMRESGLLQPITVRTVGDQYVIIAGERRYRAASALGWSEIDAIIRDDLTGDAILVAQVLENIGRQDMTPMEEARAYRRLVDMGMSIDEVGKRLGLPRWQAGWRVDLLRLIEPIQELVDRGQLPPRVARYITRLSEDGQRRALHRLATEDLNDGQVAAMVEAIEAEEAGVEMFPDLKPVSPATARTVRDVESAIAQAAAALSRLESIEDDELAGALAAKLPGLVTKTAALRSESDRLHRRLNKLASRQATIERSA